MKVSFTPPISYNVGFRSRPWASLAQNCSMMARIHLGTLPANFRRLTFVSDSKVLLSHSIWVASTARGPRYSSAWITSPARL